MTPEEIERMLLDLALQTRARGMPTIEVEVTPANWIGQTEQTKGEPYSLGKQARVTVALLAQKAARVHELRISSFGVWVKLDYAPFLDNAARALQEKRLSLISIVSTTCSMFEAEQNRPITAPSTLPK